MANKLFDYLGKTVLDTVARAGIASLVTGQDFKDVAKAQLLLGVGGDLYDQFRPKPAAPPTATPTGARSFPGTPPAVLQRAPTSAATAQNEGRRTGDFGPGASNPTLQDMMNAGTAKGNEGGLDFRKVIEDIAKSASIAPVEQKDQRGFLEALGDTITGEEGYDRWDSAKQAFFPSNPNASPLRKYGPLAGAGILGAYLGGAFEPEEVQGAQFQGPRGQTQAFRRPGMYRPGVPTISGRASGGPISGPGTGTSDDIPALLSDGEFVMTNDAVRGAGGGNREQGMQTMYNIMRDFERRV